jgi:hypothetical protein
VVLNIGSVGIAERKKLFKSFNYQYKEIIINRLLSLLVP